MKRYYRSLDSLVIAAELQRMGDPEKAMQFLTAATAMPEYAEMVEALTEDQEDLKAQQQQDNQEQASVRHSPRLSAALARVLGTENASEYPDADLWEDDELKDENDKLEEGSDDEQSEETAEGSDSAEDGDPEDQAPDFSQEDLGIDLDEQDDDGVSEEQDEETASEDDEQEQDDEQQEEQANTVTAALRVVEQAAFGGKGATNAPAKPRANTEADLKARLERNRAARA